MGDEAEALAARVREARAPLCIRGGGTKDFYGNPPAGEVFDVYGNIGVIAYDPRELVLTARAGTRLADVEALLAESGQMLAFEPPHFGEAATLGGTLGCGFSGPRRPYAGAARDFVLGVKVLDGRGRVLSFGGQVMKNVAGYDVSRLMVGALGTLGIILEVSFKVLPKPKAEQTLTFEMDEACAIATMNRWAGQPLPLSASAWVGDVLHVRLSGAESALRVARARLGGEVNPNGDEFWRGAREQTAAFFSEDRPLWRLSVPAATPPLAFAGKQALTWGGAQRWLKSDAPAAEIRGKVGAVGGHATLFRGGHRPAGAFQPLPEPLMRIHRRLKAVFDPYGIFNPGRLYAGL